MSLILDSIKSTIPEAYFSEPITNLAAYAHFTVLKSKRLGLSMTLNDDRIFEFKGPGTIHSLGSIETVGLKTIMEWTNSLHGIERSFAIAAINSCIPLSGKRYFQGNALEIARILGQNKNVVVVGHFPNMDKIKEAAAKFTILEKRPKEGDLPAEDAHKVIPEADVVALTGVTCLNDTIEGLLALKKPGAKFIVLGPTVPLSSVLFNFGVDIIGGAWVTDEKDTIKMVSQGATARYVDSIKNVLYPKDPELLNGFEEIEPPDNY